MRIDASDFDALAADLTAAARADLAAELGPVVSKAAVNVKAGMQADMAASQHFHQVAPSITYDRTVRVGGVEAEVGPETGGRVVGDLAHLAYFVGVNGGGGTVRDPEVHLEQEGPRFESAAGDVLDAFLGRL